MINLNDLLKHEILDLYSAEEQIIEALPAMIEKAKNPELKKALREHLKITEEQKSRLDKVKESFGEGEQEGEKKGFFSRLFGGSSGGEKCRGMEGLITEGEKIMAADITDEALDAAIIASAQKIEHYEICGYGTARAFAKELRLGEVERLLTQTLNEEYEADDKLTALAVGKLNEEAEMADGIENGNGKERRSGKAKAGSSGGGKDSSKSGNKPSKRSSSSSSGGSKGGSKSSGKGSSSKAGSKSSVNAGSSKRGSKSSANAGSSKGGSKSSANAGSSKGVSKSSGGGSRSSGKGGSSKSGSKSTGGGSRSSKGSSKGGSRSGGSKGGTKSGSSKSGSRRK